ncbi:MAG: hypothetical protein LCH86_17760 [Proteobacteria bacterium]|nr:hypothetical protein [Pseudomonadota bacterium]
MQERGVGYVVAGRKKDETRDEAATPAPLPSGARRLLGRLAKCLPLFVRRKLRLEEQA